MITIKRFTFGPFSENTFIVWDEISKSAAIVDPGCIEMHEEDTLAAFISRINLRIKYLIVTHGHIDHVAGCDFVYRKYSPVFLAPELDVELLNHVELQGRMYSIKVKTPPAPDKFISSEHEYFLGSNKMNFIFTPGHTPGEHCIYFPENKVCITGDVLFKGSIGRTDLWGGDYDTLMNSIWQKLLTLPDDVIIYPGHGDSSKIGLEKKENPFLKINL